jgi:hypothetical protein
LAQVKKFCHGSNWFLTFAAIPRQQFPVRIALELAEAQIVLQWHKICSFTPAMFMCVLDVLGQLIWSLSWMPVQPFSNSLEHFLA